MNEEEIEQQLGGSFLKYRIRNEAVPPPPDSPRPPQETIAGAFIADFEARIAAAEAAGTTEDALELRESLRIGRLLLEDPNSVQLV